VGKGRGNRGWEGFKKTSLPGWTLGGLGGLKKGPKFPKSF